MIENPKNRQTLKKYKNKWDLINEYKNYVCYVEETNKNIIYSFTNSNKYVKINDSENDNSNIKNNNDSNNLTNNNNIILNNSNIDNNILIPNIFSLNKYLDINNIVINNWIIKSNNNNLDKRYIYKELLEVLRIIYIDLRELITHLLLNHPTRKNGDLILKMLEKNYNNIFKDDEGQDLQPINIMINSPTQMEQIHQGQFNNKHKTLKVVKVS